MGLELVENALSRVVAGYGQNKSTSLQQIGMAQRVNRQDWNVCNIYMRELGRDVIEWIQMKKNDCLAIL